MLKQIIFRCVAISRRAALQMPFVATIRDERIYGFQIRSNNLIPLLAWMYWYPWGTRFSSLSVLLTKCKIIHETPLSTLEKSTGDTHTKHCRSCQMQGRFSVYHIGNDHTTHHHLRETTILGISKSSCNIVLAQTGTNRMKIVINEQTTEAEYFGLYKRPVFIAETVNVTP